MFVTISKIIFLAFLEFSEFWIFGIKHIFHCLGSHAGVMILDTFTNNGSVLAMAANRPDDERAARRAARLPGVRTCVRTCVRKDIFNLY